MWLPMARWSRSLAHTSVRTTRRKSDSYKQRGANGSFNAKEAGTRSILFEKAMVSIVRQAILPIRTVPQSNGLFYAVAYRVIYIPFTFSCRHSILSIWPLLEVIPPPIHPSLELEDYRTTPSLPPVSAFSAYSPQLVTQLLPPLQLPPH